MKIKLLLILSAFYCLCHSQNLDKLSRKEKNQYLIETAKGIVKKYGPGYYREYKKPIIQRDTISNRDDLSEDDKKEIGRVFFRVHFPYDSSLDYLGTKYIASVTFWEDTGQPSSVFFACGFGLFLDSDTITNNTIKIHYQSIQQKFVNMDDYMVRWSFNLSKSQQDSLQIVQDSLWIKYEEEEKRLKKEHIKADSLREVEIMKKYNIPRD